MTHPVPPWCTSNWSTLHHNVLRPGADPRRPRLLHSRREVLYRGIDEPAQLSVGVGHATLQFHTASVDPGRLTYLALRHLTIAGDRVRRTPPIAIGPLAFVEEWLAATWLQSTPSCGGPAFGRSRRHAAAPAPTLWKWSSTAMNRRPPYFLQVHGTTRMTLQHAARMASPGCQGASLATE